MAAEKNEKHVVVRMTRRYENNVVGDVCNFPAALAEKLIRMNAAEKLREVDVPPQGTMLQRLNDRNQAFDEFMEERLRGPMKGRAETRA